MGPSSGTAGQRNIQVKQGELALDSERQRMNQTIDVVNFHNNQRKPSGSSQCSHSWEMPNREKRNGVHQSGQEIGPNNRNGQTAGGKPKTNQVMRYHTSIKKSPRTSAVGDNVVSPLRLKHHALDAASCTLKNTANLHDCATSPNG